jgi:DNA-binding NarL/FixJ family response regulator
VLVITGDLVPEHINRACRPGVAFLAKPFSKEDISRFARSTTDAAEKRLQSALSACARRYRFCAAETEVLSFGLECEEHAEIASRRSCSIHTVQSHVTSMLKKSGARSLHGLVTEVLREAAGLNTGAPPKTSTG